MMIAMIFHSKKLLWTRHARSKMEFYKLSEARVRRVLHSPRRVEEGVAPRTVAMMQPGTLKMNGNKATWNQEIWVMVQDEEGDRRVVSAWRYPGVTKPRSEAALNLMRKEYDEFINLKPKI